MTRPASPILDFIGIGAARCGTTWLSRCLEEHPQVVFSARKELHFFNHEALYRSGGLGWLASQFGPRAEGQIRGEFTPRYLADLRALHRIERHFPDAKLLVVLRDPVERLLSQYRYLRFDRFREPARDVFSAIEGPNFTDYVLKSRYAEQLTRVRELFDPANLHDVVYEALVEDPAVFRDLLAFLGVDASFRAPSLARRINRSTAEADAPRPLTALHCQLHQLQPVHPLAARAQWWARDLTMRAARVAVRHGRPVRPLGHVLSPVEKQQLFETYFAADVARLASDFGVAVNPWGSYEEG